MTYKHSIYDKSKHSDIIMQHNVRLQASLKIGDHVCAIHKDNETYIQSMTDFIAHALTSHQKVISLNELRYQDIILNRLSNEGLTLKDYFKTGQLELNSIHDTYLNPGHFNSQYAMGILGAKAEKSLSEGYCATFFTGNASLSLQHIHTDTWINYEKSIKIQALKNLKCFGLCNYHIDETPAHIVNKILEGHPLCQVGSDLLVNSNFVPAEVHESSDHEKELFDYKVEQMYNLRQREEIIYNLYEKTEKLQEFSHILGHELKAPIRSANVFGDLLVRETLDDGMLLDEKIYEELKKVLKVAYERIESVEEISSLLNPTFHSYEVDIKKVFLTVCEEYSPKIKVVNAQFDDSQLQSHILMADRTHIHQVLANLISNALKYSKVDAPLLIHVSSSVSQNNEIIIKIQDNGIGIPTRLLKKIFLPFVRLNPTKVPMGKGMGLTICQRIMEIYGGRIEVESIEGEGTTFTLFFPLN